MTVTSFTTLLMTDFHDLPYSQYNDLITTICNNFKPQLNFDGFNPGHDVLKLFNSYA